MKKLLLIFSFVIAAFTASAQTWYIAGNGTGTNNWCCGQDWAVNVCTLTNNGNDMFTYTATVPAGTYNFKITNGKWYDEASTPDGINYGYTNINAAESTKGYEEGGNNNVKFTVSSEATINITLNITADDSQKITLISSVPFGDIVITSWTLVGPSWLFGSAWDPSISNNNMEKGEGYEWTKTYRNVAWDASMLEEGKDKIEFKAVANHDYSAGEIPGANQNAKIDPPAEAGNYDFTFTLNTFTNLLEGSYVPSQSSAVEETAEVAISAANGLVSADGEMVIYDLIGNDVTAQNGNLKGNYIVVVNGNAQKVNVQ